MGAPSSESFDGRSITKDGGFRQPKEGSRSGTIDTIIVYDVGLCYGDGYVAYNSLGKCIAMPRDVLLFHELAHVQYFQSGSKEQAIADENRYRRWKGLPERQGHAGSCYTDAQSLDSCQVNPNN